MVKLSGMLQEAFLVMLHKRCVSYRQIDVPENKWSSTQSMHTQGLSR
ncbi:MAG: hypothetical protein PHC91_03045 [Eubacteriales bacterium]|nr:hypothetical protein [Eubacteriales bacterium]